MDASVEAVSGSYFDSLIFRICHQLPSDARCNITLSTFKVPIGGQGTRNCEIGYKGAAAYVRRLEGAPLHLFIVDNQVILHSHIGFSLQTVVRL
jgi:hypothetical protein